MKLKTYLLFSLFVTIIACHRDRQEPLQIEAAEKSVNEGGGKVALRLLAEIADEMRTAPESVRMRYELVLLRAYGAIGEPRDSLLPRLIDYYERAGTPNERMSLYFYRAVRAQDMNDYYEAEQNFEQAIQLIDTLREDCNRGFSCLVYFYAGNLCMLQKYYSEAIQKYKQSIAVLPSWYYTVSALNGCLARAHYKNKEIDKAAAYYDLVYKDFTKGIQYSPQLTEELFEFYTQTKNWRRVKYMTPQMYDLILYTTDSILVGNFYRNRAAYFEAKGLEDSVVYYLNKAVTYQESEDKVQTYYALFRNKQKHREYRSATEYAQHYLSLNDSFLNKQKKTEIDRFNQEKLKMQQKHLQIIREQEDSLNKWICYAVGCSIFIVILLVMAIRLYRKHIIKNRNLLEYADGEIENRISPFTGIAERFRDLADKGKKASAEDWEDLMNCIHQAYPGFAKECQTRCHALNNTEWQVCCLSCIGLRQKQMACLLNTSQQNVHNIRNRLYTRFTGEQCKTVKQFANLIEEFKQMSICKA